MTPRTDIAEPRERAGTFSVEAFLAQLDPARCAPGSDELRRLEAIVKRVTISGRLHAFYTPDIARPADDEPAAPGYAELYCEHLVDAARAHDDWKLLNAAFAALDAGLADDERAAGRAEAVLAGMGRRGS